ncbi:MAG: replication initiator protein A [Clostridium sp.]|nr:replication initiator protein A [Clostridium sp.]
MNNYIKLPKDIIENERKLPEKAVRLYAMMLDRYSLSERNNWHDKNGIYIIFSQAEIQERLSVKKRRASSLLAALKEAHLITCRKQPGRPDRIYLAAKSVSNISYQDSSVNNKKNKTQEFYDFYVSFFEDMAYQDADYGRSENIQENKKCISDCRESSKEKKLKRKACVKKCTTGGVKKVHHNNNTKYTKRNIFNQSKKKDAIKPAHEKCKADFARQVEYDALIADEPESSYLQLIVETAADALASEKDYIKCAGSLRWSHDVKSRLQEVNFTHVKYILECVKGTSAPIRSPKAYLLTCLYNAPLTMKAYYERQAEHALSYKASAKNTFLAADRSASMDEWDKMFLREINPGNVFSQ